ncbi:hypothetical protein [Cryptosporangium sp. NPDC048952]|uniref:hypothetical protein n=1 Tax=Cryptosporangium sp. NPDC048952 TaxID=3363961 RepID=UPI00371B0266
MANLPEANAERSGWQYIAYQALDIILERGRKAQLAPLYWEVRDTVRLAGTVPPYLSATEQRALFEAWVALLRLIVQPENRSVEPVELRASAEQVDLNDERIVPRPDVYITARFWKNQ